MLKLLKPLPKNLVIALSGGVDSMALCDFLSRKHQVLAAFFHHGTENSERAFRFVAQYCTEHNIPMLFGLISGTKPGELSYEEWWREERYKFLHSIKETVVTAHHLDDCVETWIWSSLHGVPKTIPYSRHNVVRPLLTTRKDQLVDWAQRHDVPWIEDTSNDDTGYTRNYIRHEMMPHVLRVNPGIHKVVKRQIDMRMASCDNTSLTTTGENNG